MPKPKPETPKERANRIAKETGDKAKFRDAAKRAADEFQKKQDEKKEGK